MKPPLSAAHGTSLGTTAGITAVISVVVAVSVLGQCGGYVRPHADFAACALGALVLGAAALYRARDEIGRSLDLAASDPRDAGIAAARGLTRFHLGMAGVFAGCGIAAGLRFSTMPSALGWLMPAIAGVVAAGALARAWSWAREARRRGASPAAP